MHVYLNPGDLILMAARLGFGTTKELFQRGFVIIDHERGGAPLPRIRFRRAVVKHCPFLENRLEEDGRLLGLCLLHPDFKPLICGLAPLWREVDLDADKEVWGVKKPFPACPGCDAEVNPGNNYGEIVDPEVLSRLYAEKQFFRRLSNLLDEGVSEGLIIEELYYLSIESERDASSALKGFLRVNK